MAELKNSLNDMNWTIVSSEYLFRRPWLTVRRDCVRLPNGTENPEFYVLEYPTWVNVIAITESGEFVMIRQYRHGIQQTRYELVAGCTDPGETPEEAARRELSEEAGYSGGRWTLLTVLSPNASTTNNYTYCFVAEGVVKTDIQHLDATEDIEICLLTREQVFHLLEADELKQALMAAPLWKYFYHEDALRGEASDEEMFHSGKVGSLE